MRARAYRKTFLNEKIYGQVIDRARSLAGDGVSTLELLFYFILSTRRQCVPTIACNVGQRVRTESKMQSTSARYLNVCFGCHKAVRSLVNNKTVCCARHARMSRDFELTTSNRRLVKSNRTERTVLQLLGSD